MNLKNLALGLALAIGATLSGAALAGDRHHDRDWDRGHHSWHHKHHDHGHHWRGHGHKHQRYGHHGHGYRDRVVIHEVHRPVYYERNVYYEPYYYPRRPAVVIGVDIPPVRIPF